MSAPQREPVRGHEVQQPPVAGGGGGGRASAPGVVKPKPTLRPGVGGCRRRTCGVSATGCAGFRDRGVAHAAHADTLAFAPRDPGRRVLRGGSWFDYAGLLRPGARFGVTAALRGDGRGFRVSRTLEGRPRPPGSQAPGQVGTFPPAASAPRSRRTRTRNRTPAPRRSASGIGTRGTPCAGGSSRAPGFPRAHETPDRQPRGRSKYFEKRDVDRPHDPPVEAAARRQDPEQFRAGTRDSHDDVGVRLGHPPPVVTRQQAEDRRLVVRMDAERPAVRPLPQTTRRTLPRTKLLRQLRKHRARAAFRGEVNVGIAWSPNSGRRG